MIPALALAPLKAALKPVLAFVGPHIIPLLIGALAALWVAVWSPPLSVPPWRVPLLGVEIWNGQIFDGGYAARLKTAREDLEARETALADITLQLVGVTARLEAEERATAEAEAAIMERQEESARLAAQLDRAETEAARLRRLITDQSNEEIANVAPDWAAVPVPDVVRAARLRRSCAFWAGAGLHHPACGSAPADDRAPQR